MSKFKKTFNIPFHDFITTSFCNMKCEYCFTEKYNAKITVEEFKKLYSQKSSLDFSIFGGEPLLCMDLIEEFLKSGLKKKRDGKTYNFITNGTLIPKYIDRFDPFKKIVEFQISLDGNKEAHDLNRKYLNGKGTFDDVIKGVKTCIEKEYGWGIHGVCPRNTLKYFAESLMFIFDLLLSDKRMYPIDKAIKTFGKNTIQIVMEDEYTDEDIDVMLEQIDILENMIFKREDLNKEQKIKLLTGILTNKAGICSGGTTLMTVAPDFDLYTCHRYSELEDKGQFHMGSIHDPNSIYNTKILNSYSNIRKFTRGYSSVLDITQGFNENENVYWMYWCPATFYQATGSIYKIPSKYNVFMLEMNRKIQEVLQKYGYKPERSSGN